MNSLSFNIVKLFFIFVLFVYVIIVYFICTIMSKHKLTNAASALPVLICLKPFTLMAVRQVVGLIIVQPGHCLYQDGWKDHHTTFFFPKARLGKTTWLPDGW